MIETAVIESAVVEIDGKQWRVSNVFICQRALKTISIERAIVLATSGIKRKGASIWARPLQLMI